MRNLPQLIDSMLLFVPPEEKAVIENFETVRQSAEFSAPELKPLRWGQLQEALMDCVTEINSETPEWKMTIACLFSNTPRHQLQAKWDG